MYGDGIGYVALLDVMGDEFTPAEDARTSTGKGRLGPEKDAALQERLRKDGHTSPFEGVIAKFEVCAPLFVVRELDRHRTLDKNSEDEVVTPEENMRKWMARNEMSGRYIQMPNEYYHPKAVRSQDKRNKQGTSDSPVVSPDVGEKFVREGIRLTVEARALYDWAVLNGIEKGIARIYNTQNQYTKIRYTASLKNWCDMLYLRLPNVVLWECRRVAEEIEKMLLEVFPDPLKSWRRNVYDTVKLTADEVELLKNFFDACDFKLDEYCSADDPRVYDVLKRIKAF